RVDQDRVVPWGLVLIAAQQETDQEADTDRDQQRLARVGADIGADLIGDGAEVDVFHLLAHAVVSVAHRAGSRLVLFADVFARASKTSRRFTAARLACSGAFRFVHGYLLCATTISLRPLPIAAGVPADTLSAPVRISLDHVSHDYGPSDESAPVHVLDDVSL